MSFNGCLIGNWCVGGCKWCDNDYRGICHYDPIEDCKILCGEGRLVEMMTVMELWSDLFNYIEYGGVI